MAKQIKSPSHAQTNGAHSAGEEQNEARTERTMTFDLQDTSDIFVPDVTISSGSSVQNGKFRPSVNGNVTPNICRTGTISSSFRTDTQISGVDPQRPREHELKRWEPANDSSINMSLDDSGAAGWDQFAANANMYGVESTYDENVYTTALNRNHPQYKQRQAEADRIAREIESSLPADAHIAEERTRDTTHDEGGDEEDKYSGVRREAAPLPRRAAGAYVPPSQRPITGAPTVPGAPFDPAIISSQLSQPAQSSNSAAATSTTAAASSVSSAKEQHQSAKAAGADGPATEMPQKKSREVTTEDHVRDTADAFKQFANTEKLRLRQAQEAKRSNARQEKNVKLNDLKKFAENFKLKSRVPDDLVPILAKDRDKQLEIQSKAEAAAKEEEQKSKEKTPTTASTTSPPTTVPAGAPAPSLPPPADQRLPHNRARQPPQNRQPPPPIPPFNAAQSPRGQQFNQRHPSAQFFNNRPMMAPPDLRMSVGPASTSGDIPHSPQSATRLNVNAKAFEFRPAASAFTPSGTSPSPQRSLLGVDQSRAKQRSFFDGKKLKAVKDVASCYSPLVRIAEAEYPEPQRKAFASNGDFPQAYSTPPTWTAIKANEGASYLDSFPRPASAPPSNQIPSPMHTPNSTGSMPPMHQMPHHFQQPSASTPPQRHYFPQPPPPGAPYMDARLQQHPQWRGSPTMQYRMPPGPMPPPQQFGGPPMMAGPPPHFVGGPPPAGAMQHQFQQPPPMMPPQQYVGQQPYRSPQPYRSMPGQMPYQNYMR